MSIEKVTSNSVLVHWEAPKHSLFSSYAIRYRTESEKEWFNLPSVRTTEADVTDMTPGEKYTIQVNTVSYGVESPMPQQVNQTVRPNPVSGIIPVADSTNITLEWPRPEGRIETYVLSWWPAEKASSVHTKNVSENNVCEYSEIRMKIHLFAKHSDPKYSNLLILAPIDQTNNKNKFDETPIVRILIEDLMPGAEYKFDIHSISYDLVSDVTQFSARTLPLIQSEVLVVNNHGERDTVTLSYTPTPQTSSQFDLYRFSLGDPDIPDKEKLANDTDRKVTFNGLVPGRLYNITVWTVSGGIQSLPIRRQDRMYPEPITQLNATRISDTEITLKWDIPQGEYNAFQIQYLRTDSDLTANVTEQDGITITNLKPHRNYTFTVNVQSGTESSVLRHSLPFSASFTTKESVPGSVNRFVPIDIQPSQITFEWSLPTTEQNGILRQFSVTYGLEGSSHTQVREFKPTELQGTITNLLPGRAYAFRIQAKTSIGFGPETIWKQKMPILAPPKPALQVVPTEVYRSSSSIQIRFRKNYFSDANGQVMFAINMFVFKSMLLHRVLHYCR